MADDRPIERLLGALPDAKRMKDGWSAKCPAHADTTPSLSISEGEDGTVLVNCFAGCSTEAVVAELGLGMRDLFRDRDRPRGRSRRERRRNDPARAREGGQPPR